MRHGSLFSGIGGFDLAAEWMGWENVFHCEWNPFGQKVLNHYWPKAETFTDITKSDFTKFNGTIDIISGGFPCQPYSQAGKRKGKEDERHLWPQMLRAIREVQPGWIVGENVSGLLNWNGGMVLNEIKTDLESSGFEVVPPCVLPACGVNAPHRRDRVWIVAYSHSNRNRNIERQDREKDSLQKFNRAAVCTWELAGTDTGDVTYAGNQGLQGRPEAGNAKGGEWENSSKEQRTGRNERTVRNGWQKFPTQPPLCNGNDGISAKMDGITFSKWRTESIKAGGNAIVPQVVFEIFKAIEAYDRT